MGIAKDNFKKNMGKIIHDIYETAYGMFANMPQGDHKKRAKYRFASKTLMRILPSPQKEVINDLIERKEIQLDLYDILSKCTWREEVNRSQSRPSPRRRRRAKARRRR